MIVKLLTEHHLEFLSLKGGCTGLPESRHVKMPHCWKSHALAHFCFQVENDVTSRSKAMEKKTDHNTREEQFKFTNGLTVITSKNTVSPEAEVSIDVGNSNENQIKSTDALTVTSQNTVSPMAEGSIDIGNSNEKQIKSTDALTVTSQNTVSPMAECSIDIGNSNENQIKSTNALTVTSQNTVSPEVGVSIDIGNSNENQIKSTDALTVTSQNTVSPKAEGNIDICNTNEKQYKSTDGLTPTSLNTVSPKVEDSIDICNINEKQFKSTDVLTVSNQDIVSPEAQDSIDNCNTNEKQFKSTNALTEDMNQNTMTTDVGDSIDICTSQLDKDTSESERNSKYLNAEPDSCMANNKTVDPFNETLISHGTLNTGVKRIDMDNGYERNRYKKTWTQSSRGSTRPFVLFSGFHLPRLLREHKGKTKRKAFVRENSVFINEKVFAILQQEFFFWKS